MFKYQNRIKTLFSFFSLFLFCQLSSQTDSLFNRLQAIKNVDIVYYNVDGYTITREHINKPFNEKGLKKAYRKYSIKKKENKSKDEQLSYNNFNVNINEVITEKLTQNNSYYFIENYGLITVIQFASINKKNKEFERIFVKHIMERTIPKENFNSLKLDTINFAGRKIKLSSNCNWMNVNNVQCPYNGQMNWSVHNNLNDAKTTVEQQFEITKSKKGGKIISEQQVDIIFEGTKAKAKKVVYDFTGLTSVLASMSGGKTLTIYYIAAKVRANYVSCVFSFWNNDYKTETGLTSLLDEFIKLKD